VTAGDRPSALLIVANSHDRAGLIEAGEVKRFLAIDAVVAMVAIDLVDIAGLHLGPAHPGPLEMTRAGALSADQAWNLEFGVWIRLAEVPYRP
jgi:hypothetical protein